MEEELAELKREKLEMKQDILTLQEHLKTMVDNLGDRELQKEIDQSDPKEHFEELYDQWNEESVLVVGGHVNWQNRMKQFFPNWQFIASDRKNVSKEEIQGKDYIVFNVEILSHACYYKILAGRTEEQKILYVHSNNPRMCMSEMEGQI